jgi:PPOX class probable F420-dependent enzyme
VDELNLPGWAKEVLAASRVGRLGLTDDAGAPRVLPVTFALVGDEVWSAVDDKPKSVRGRELARVRWLRQRPRASFLVDRYDDDWERLAWVQLLGTVEVLDDAEPPRELIERYEAYRRRPPAGPMLRLDVERALHWRAAEDQSG